MKLKGRLIKPIKGFKPLRTAKAMHSWEAFMAVTANTGCHLIEAPTGGLRLVSANVHTHLIPDGLVTVR